MDAGDCFAIAIRKHGYIYDYTRIDKWISTRELGKQGTFLWGAKCVKNTYKCYICIYPSDI